MFWSKLVGFCFLFFPLRTGFWNVGSDHVLMNSHFCSEAVSMKSLTKHHWTATGNTCYLRTHRTGAVWQTSRKLTGFKSWKSSEYRKINFEVTNYKIFVESSRSKYTLLLFGWRNEEENPRILWSKRRWSHPTRQLSQNHYNHAQGVQHQPSRAFTLERTSPSQATTKWH